VSATYGTKFSFHFEIKGAVLERFKFVLCTEKRFFTMKSCLLIGSEIFLGMGGTKALIAIFTKKKNINRTP